MLENPVDPQVFLAVDFGRTGGSTESPPRPGSDKGGSACHLVGREGGGTGHLSRAGPQLAMMAHAQWGADLGTCTLPFGGWQRLPARPRRKPKVARPSAGHRAGSHCLGSALALFEDRPNSDVKNTISGYCCWASYKDEVLLGRPCIAGGPAPIRILLVCLGYG